MGQRWPLPSIIRSTSRFPVQPAAYPLTGKCACTDHRLLSVVLVVMAAMSATLMRWAKRHGWW